MNFSKTLAGFALAAGLLASTANAETIRIALAEPPSDELAAFFVALDRAKAGGLDYEWTAFAEEELAIQAVLSGDMDIAFGTPYAVMQRSKAPIRIIFQLSKLVFFPVTTKEFTTLKELDGVPIMLHSRGGGTDSIANVIEEREGIKFGQRSYVPGSSNRVVAMLADQAKATILDLSNRNKIIEEQGDRFTSLPMFEVKASDEALFGNLDWMQAHEQDVDILVKALHDVWGEMTADPTMVARETDPAGPIGSLPPAVLGDLDAFYTAAVAGGLYHPEGGGRDAARADLEWYVGAGQMEGDPATMNLEDYWYFAPLDAAKK